MIYNLKQALESARREIHNARGESDHRRQASRIAPAHAETQGTFGVAHQSAAAAEAAETASARDYS